MILYAKRSDGALAVYEGMSQEAVQKMLSDKGLGCTFVDKDTYAKAIADMQAARDARANAATTL